ncbi:MAG TPA: hypothetical protein VLC98_06780 [Phnomibacter sp.]|nr:hypothetical protein [Phnomibacter sp.]
MENYGWVTVGECVPSSTQQEVYVHTPGGGWLNSILAYSRKHQKKFR